MSKMTEIMIGTNNKNKITEITKIFLTVFPNMKIENLNDRKIKEPVENGTTFNENALIKAIFYYKIFNKPIITDDSGIFVEALPHSLGIHSKRYSESGNDVDNNQKLLDEMKNVETRNCHYKCSICLLLNLKEYYLFEGILHGKLNKVMAGDNGFGYDPLFYLEEYRKTVAQIDDSVKQKISHRKKALDKMIRILEKEEIYGKHYNELCDKNIRYKNVLCKKITRGNE